MCRPALTLVSHSWQVHFVNRASSKLIDWRGLEREHSLEAAHRRERERGYDRLVAPSGRAEADHEEVWSTRSMQSALFGAVKKVKFSVRMSELHGL